MNPINNAGRSRRGAACASPGLLAVLVFALSMLAASAADTAALPLPRPIAPNLGFSLLRVVGALILVIAIFLGFVWLFRNWQRFLVQRGRAPRLNILEVRSLGGRHSLYVVGYEQDRFLIAASPTGVNLLSHLAAAPDAETETAAPGISFPQALAHVLKGK